MHFVVNIQYLESSKNVDTECSSKIFTAMIMFIFPAKYLVLQCNIHLLLTYVYGDDQALGAVVFSCSNNFHLKPTCELHQAVEGDLWQTQNFLAKCLILMSPLIKGQIKLLLLPFSPGKPARSNICLSLLLLSLLKQTNTL